MADRFIGRKAERSLQRLGVLDDRVHIHRDTEDSVSKLRVTPQKHRESRHQLLWNSVVLWYKKIPHAGDHVNAAI